MKTQYVCASGRLAPSLIPAASAVRRALPALMFRLALPTSLVRDRVRPRQPAIKDAVSGC